MHVIIEKIKTQIAPAGNGGDRRVGDESLRQRGGGGSSIAARAPASAPSAIPVATSTPEPSPWVVPTSAATVSSPSPDLDPSGSEETGATDKDAVETRGADGADDDDDDGIVIEEATADDEEQETEITVGDNTSTSDDDHISVTLARDGDDTVDDAEPAAAPLVQRATPPWETDPTWFDHQTRQHLRRDNRWYNFTTAARVMLGSADYLLLSQLAHAWRTGALPATEGRDAVLGLLVGLSQWRLVDLMGAVCSSPTEEAAYYSAYEHLATTAAEAADADDPPPLFTSNVVALLAAIGNDKSPNRNRLVRALEALRRCIVAIKERGTLSGGSRTTSASLLGDFTNTGGDVAVARLAVASDPQLALAANGVLHDLASIAQEWGFVSKLPSKRA